MTVLTYVGPDGATSERFGELVRGRDYQEQDDVFAAYLAEKHPDHWRLRLAAPAAAQSKE